MLACQVLCEPNIHIWDKQNKKPTKNKPNYKVAIKKKKYNIEPSQ